MKDDPLILIATEIATAAKPVIQLFREEFDDVAVSTDPKRIVQASRSTSLLC